ncbi:hypothetical protein [Caldifermentibacillus hisashii]|uniref:hypothetical protein n=1 Tax=Caldifermentibacillus hisashii TaxID=996558 RepID=UPI001C10F36A|nr:hypothetical protein [Caldifermentibacillus hisashii]MBU5342314.1 hypothetical protein [Caldifermentibacillus hisashii]
MFNKGYYCHSCGPIQTSVKRTRKGEKFNTCPNCGQVVTEWERPLNERDGRCRTCGNGSFNLKIENHHLLRVCKNCGEIYDTDNEKITKKGNGNEIVSKSHVNERTKEAEND